MRMYIVKKLFQSLLWLCILVACKEEIPTEEIRLETSSTLVYDDMCQKDTIRFSAKGDWSVQTDADWCSPFITEGSSNGIIPVYIQQNDGEISREGTIEVISSTGEICKIDIVQNSNNTNALGSKANLPVTFGLGWGYDYRIDVADESGMKGQVIDAIKLRKYTYDDFIYQDNYATQYIRSYCEQSSSELTKAVSVGLSGEIDILVAGAKISGEFQKQDSEQKDRLYIWYRDHRIVKMQTFDEVGMLYDLSDRCLTFDFRKALSAFKRGKISAEEFVSRYGTHLIVKSFLGGKLDYYLTVSKDVNTSVETIITTITTKFLFWESTHQHVDQDVWQQISSDLVGHFEATGGGKIGEQLNKEMTQSLATKQPITNPGLMQKWADCFVNSSTVKNEDLSIVAFDVIPLWSFIEQYDSEAARKLEDYIKK